MAGFVSSDRPSTDESPRLRRAEPDLSAEAFRARIADELCLDPSTLAPSIRFVEDLEFDSVRMLELALVLDVLGVSAGAEDLKTISTVEDAYDMYVERTAVWFYGDQAMEDLSWLTAAQAPNSANLTSLRSRRTRQRPIVAGDYDYLYELTQRRDAVVFWRHRGSAVSPEAFPRMLWRSVLLQHLIVHAANGTPVGMVSAFDADLRSGTVQLDVVLDSRVQGQGWPYEAAVLFVDHLFRWWPLRKVYVRSLTALARSLESGLGRLFVEEGRLVEHEYVDAAWADLHILSTTRLRWAELAPRLIERIVDPRVPSDGEAPGAG